MMDRSWLGGWIADPVGRVVANPVMGVLVLAIHGQMTLVAFWLAAISFMVGDVRIYPAEGLYSPERRSPSFLPSTIQ